MARRVNDVDLVLAPVARRRGGRDCDTALLLLLHPVHGGATLEHLPDLVRLSRVEQDALRGGCLPGVNVRHDTDVAILFKRHDTLLIWKGKLKLK